VANGIATTYLVNKSCMVRIYIFPLLVIGKEPIISIEILLKAASGVSVIIMGSFGLTRINFLIWQTLQFRIKFWISLFILDHK